ncbi:type ISP restriction/modification enzyme [Anabaena sp. UHCC 0399]|uniref:type ISP restriction/modification enzyme n=1 Tax=Anabaena sp. UHCC 0399 TaxID=3110238 RepID=UPI002B20E235|nr:type ISP restriction/modification enzyme [Anabaena sp. UHCC 0399]MEA5567519.1 type ISP restriction/modification enzyme [Anabaena sp. UHCC 0399]
MVFTKEQLQDVIGGTDINRVEALRQMLGYPVKERDPLGSRFWYLRPGADEEEAEETCPIAVGFYEELSGATDHEIKRFLTSKEQQQEIYGHYTNRVAEQQPVMYLLLPTEEVTGRVPLVLPNEGGLRQRQIQTFDWNEPQLIARLNRLKQGELPIAAKGLRSVPLVEWVFYEPIKTAKELAQLLAEAARRIEQAILSVYKKEKADGYLHNLLKSFQRELLPTLQLTSDNEKDYSFADIYAQTIAYALFTAKVFSYVKDKREGREKETHFDRESAWQQLPETNPFLRKLFKDVSEREPEELGDELIGAIADIFGILRAAKMDAILSDFEKKIGQEDIIIRFYEDFLAAYKPQMRERRGVYYTPEPVVSYMVRSVDILVKEKFNKPLGLADPEVMILDPACGTGTFLLWICKLIYQRFQESPEALTDGLDDKSWSGYVKQRLLPRIFGFELLMSPYAIAHLKIGLFLEETGYQVDSSNRLEIYLINTLEDITLREETQQLNLAIPQMENLIAEEARAGSRIKKQEPIMVVIGNPPYSYDSSNNEKWISDLVRDYYKVDGKDLGERNPKGLQDDYVKFIRFAQWRIDETNQGILAFVTNHGFLDNPTFRGMRQHLINSFDGIFIYDLHGNSKKKEICPDGSKDENIFDIQQGVSIILSVKGKDEYINHSSLYGLREHKHKILSKNTIDTTTIEKLKPQSPFYLLIPQDTNLLVEYERGYKISEIMPVNSVGITTARDDLTIHWSKDEVWDTIQKFLSLPPEEARSHFNLGKDARDWKVELAQDDLRKDLDLNRVVGNRVLPILYRVFDIRYTYFTGRSRGFHSMPRGEIMRHMIYGENMGLLISNQVINEFRHIFVSSILTNKNATDTAGMFGSGPFFPLYLYSDPTATLQQDKRPNFSANFLKNIKLRLGYLPTPEAIFYYIYAFLYSPTYRTRYSEFLKVDFPRIHLTSDNSLFLQLAEYGEELVGLHLMKLPRLNNFITKFIENGGNQIVDSGYPKYNQGTVVINKKSDKFAGVPEEVWNFYVGGYQVCQKWLKDRKGRTLTSDDIQHYQRIVVALKETIELMANIDAVIPAWPIQ